MAHDRARRPDQNSGLDPSSVADGASMTDIPEGGTYFLGRYRVVDEIGVGGMASVHLARMDGPGGFQKWVAIKKIHAHLVEDESFVQMFLDEARVAARISHPNVATVFDLGKHDTTYWIAMEYLHGEPLREVMRRTEELGTAMPPEIACRVIADAAEGLHAAHELLGKNGEKLGLVHRDVTPHNLFVTYDGVTKVVDFGIAKFSSRVSQTRAGTLKGKLAYMSPEQVQGEGIDRRTDIFALGVVLWELTTGQRLFRMDSDIDTLARVQECVVPRPSTLIRGYPVDLEKIVMKTLSKNRGERFRTARELSRALQSLLMRRGLFIASDEVASYTQSIFADRIQKREAHLRWASEVTQTINIDQLVARAEHSVADPMPSSSAVPRATPAVSAPAPRPAAGAHPLVRATPSDAFRAPGPPRPAAGEPAHPGADWMDNSEAPTHHGIPLMEEPAHATPPTLLASRNQRPIDDDDDDGGQTMAVLHEDEIEEDQDATLVALGPDPSDPSYPRQQTQSTEYQLAQPMSAYGSGPMGFHQGQPPQYPHGSSPSMTTESPMSMSSPMAFPGQLGPGHPSMPHETFGPPGSQPMAPPAGYNPRGGSPARATADGRNHRTMLAQRFRRRPPMWMVAALSCSFALFIAGVVIAIMSTTSSKPRTAKNGVPTGVASASAGPFTAARSAFNTVLSAAPTTSVAPTTTSVTGGAPTASAVPAASTASLNGSVTAPAPTPPAPLTAATTAAPVQLVPTSAPRPTAQTTPAPVVAPARPAAAQKPGWLTVVCVGARGGCEQIIDNGAPLGSGNLYGRSVPAGRHLLELSAANGVKRRVPVEVLADKTTEVRLPMDKP